MSAPLLRLAHLARRLFDGPLPIVLLVALLILSLSLMGTATQAYTEFGRIYSALLLTNTAALILLIGLIAGHLLRLIARYRRNEAGSRLTVRLVLMFVILAATPVSVVYYFSLDFLHRGIDSWFDVRIEHALDDAIELSRASLDGRSRELLRQTEQAAEQLTGLTDSMAALRLDDLRRANHATEAALFTSKGRILAISSTDPSTLVPVMPHDGVLGRTRQNTSYVGLDPLADGRLHVRTAAPVPSNDPLAEPRLLQILYPVSPRINELADGVQSAYAHYRELTFLREPLKDSFTLTLSLVLLLSILAAVWTAFLAARRLTQPISDLAEGTRAVAEGDLSRRLPVTGRDELGFLVLSFNQMTRRIERAQQALQASQQRAEEQHAYIEAVLDHLSSGVLTFADTGALTTANRAAEQILGCTLQPLHGEAVAALAQRHPWLAPLGEALQDGFDSPGEWQREVALFGGGGRQILICRGTPLSGERGGHVVVFDDVTTLIQAQRDAAWGEVARRLAHEIKNPLTPIQLAAERLRRKYLATMPADQADLLDRSTRTIVHQVEALKELVKAFSDYARPPRMNPQPLDLVGLVDEVLELYRAEPGLTVELHCEGTLPTLRADTGRLRQVVHNLVRNAREAVDGEAHVRFTLRCPQGDGSCPFIELSCHDNGPGFADGVMDHLFEPYVSTKPKGTGLGLAIVKRIVDEHGGIIQATNPPAGGACITLRLPISGHNGTTGTSP